jgi:uncharacterized protein
MHPFLLSLVGGLLIGLASWLLLLTLGRVAGISGIASGLMASGPLQQGERGWRWAFLAGLLLAGGVAASVIGHPATGAARPLSLLAVAGLLVGYGTVLGSGCTSGHGVCGLGRLSARSLAATLTFMGTGMLTVWLAKAWTV